MLLLGDNFSLIRARSLSSRLFKVTVHFIQGLSEPFKAKFIEEINRQTKYRLIFVYIADMSCLKSFPFSVAPDEG